MCMMIKFLNKTVFYIFSMFNNFPSSRWEKLLPITHPASPLVSQKSNVLQKSKSPVSPKSNVENIKFKEIHICGIIYMYVVWFPD